MSFIRSPEYPKKNFERVAARAAELGLRFTVEELKQISPLDTPKKIQDYLDRDIGYNGDYLTSAERDTAYSPKQVLQHRKAHCFEGALFAYTCLFLHGYQNDALSIMLLLGIEDQDHNLCVYQDKESGQYGAIAKSGSRLSGLGGREAGFTTFEELANAYSGHYGRYGDHLDIEPEHRNITSLLGYSEGINLVDKFGTDWMDSTEMLWEIYYTYIDPTVQCHYLGDDSPKLHPFIQAIESQWIGLDGSGNGIVVEQNLPDEAMVWWRIWKNGIKDDYQLVVNFFLLTGVTQAHLESMAQYDLKAYITSGYRIDGLRNVKRKGLRDLLFHK